MFFRRRLPEASKAACAVEEASRFGAALLHIMSPSSCSISSIDTLDQTIIPLSNVIGSPSAFKANASSVIQPELDFSKATPASHQRVPRRSAPPLDSYFSLLPLPMHMHHLQVEFKFRSRFFLTFFTFHTFFSRFPRNQSFLKKFRRSPFIGICPSWRLTWRQTVVVVS